MSGDTSDRDQSDADQQATSAKLEENSVKLDELLRKQAEVPAAPATAVSPTDRSSDRKQSDANQAVNVERNADDRAQSDADQVLTVERLDRLVAASEELSRSAFSVADATAAEIALAKVARKRFMKAMASLGAVVLLLLAPMLVLLIQGAGQRSEIRDCIDPTGACFKKDAVGAKRIQKIEDIIVAAVVCSAQPGLPTLPANRSIAVRECIQKGLPK